MIISHRHMQKLNRTLLEAARVLGARVEIYLVKANGKITLI